MSKRATTRPRFYTRRRAKWAGLAVSVALVAVIVGSFFIGYRRVWATPKYERLVTIGAGSVGAAQVDRDPPRDVWLRSIMPSGFRSTSGEHPYWWPYFSTTPGTDSWFAAIPLWPLLLLVAAPTAWLFRIDSRAKAWQCSKCRYDLRGLDGDICPECGSAAKGLSKTAAGDAPRRGES